MATALTPTNTGAAADVLEASTTWVVTFGFTATAGRLLTLLVANRSTDPSSSVATPSGWTSVINRLESGGVSPRLQMFYRPAVGGETTVTLTKSTAIGFFAVIVDEYDVTLHATPADQSASADGAGATVTTRTATTATSAANVISFAAIAIREGTASSALTVSGETWYQRAAYRMVAGGSDMLICTAAAQATAAETFTGTWTWTVANRAVVGTYTIRRATAAVSRFKVWSGSAFVAKPVKVWSGSAWVTKPAKVWNGSAWV